MGTHEKVTNKRAVPSVARISFGGRLAVAALALGLIPGALSSGMFATSGANAAEVGVLPDGSLMPVSALLAPASVSSVGEWLATPPSTSTTISDGTLQPGVVVADSGADTGGSLLGIDDAVASSTANQLGIPAPALAAYQRAETVINAADPGCRLPWELLAAIGRVESDHGQFGGSTVGANGVVTPSIIGIPLNGSSGTSTIADTDDGSLDSDTQWDRAVGPMQFIPATWSSVGVDADGDDIRNPQDIDDAALAAAVYLCSGSGDLSTTDGQRSAIYRYNHSTSYVALVLSIMADYGSSAVTSVPVSFPNPTTPGSPPLTSPSPSPVQGTKKPNKPEPVTVALAGTRSHSGLWKRPQPASPPHRHSAPGGHRAQCPRSCRSMHQRGQGQQPVAHRRCLRPLRRRLHQLTPSGSALPPTRHSCCDFCGVSHSH